MPQKVILCIDDEKTILDSLKGQLKRNLGSRFAYDFAQTAVETFELIEDYQSKGAKVVMIITDWLMPDTEGNEFLKSLQLQHPEIVKVILTGHAESIFFDEVVRETHVAALLHKPWSEEELMSVISKNIDSIL